MTRYVTPILLVVVLLGLAFAVGYEASRRNAAADLIELQAKLADVQDSARAALAARDTAEARYQTAVEISEQRISELRNQVDAARAGSDAAEAAANRIDATIPDSAVAVPIEIYEQVTTELRRALLGARQQVSALEMVALELRERVISAEQLIQAQSEAIDRLQAELTAEAELRRAAVAAAQPSLLGRLWDGVGGIAIIVATVAVLGG